MVKSIHARLAISLITVSVMVYSCHSHNISQVTRQPVDTVGFATRQWQTDSILERIERFQADKLAEAQSHFDPGTNLRVAISPHDDYAYAGYLYPALLQYVRPKVVLMFGVGHKAKAFRIEDKLVFGSYSSWKSPAGTVHISDLQAGIMKRLPKDFYIIHDSLQAAEHSLEALVPFLEHNNRTITIIPVIVPCMSFNRMQLLAASLSEAVSETMAQEGLIWGKDWSIIISTDAVHYGNEDWGGKNYDRFGVDSSGYMQTVAYEMSIVNDILSGPLTLEKIRSFSECTVREDDYHEYKWTWCGRYCVPLGLLTAWNLAEKEGTPLTGIACGYSTSIANETLPVHDLGMGTTAPARLAHWVGYAAIGYE